MIATRTYCFDDQALPLVYEAEPDHRPDQVVEFLRGRRGELLADLQRHGAVLLRGFAIAGASAFQAAVSVVAPPLINYAGGDSPRVAVNDKVYVSTTYPPALPISLHNEMSYSRDFPHVIAFHCEAPATTGGETTLGDCRKVFAALPAAITDRLRSKRLRYVQNLSAKQGIGRTWRETFETTDRERVEDILRGRGAEFEWRDDGGLRVAEIVDPVITHPVTGETVVFSQAHQWHISNLDAKTRATLLKLKPESEQYHYCSFADGTPLDEGELDVMRTALEAATVSFPWRSGDVMLVDNILVAHGRRPFTGQRRVLVAMA